MLCRHTLSETRWNRLTDGREAVFGCLSSRICLDVAVRISLDEVVRNALGVMHAGVR